MTEVKDSFKELGVYNVVLFNKLDTIKSHSQVSLIPEHVIFANTTALTQIIKERLDVEYGK